MKYLIVPDVHEKYGRAQRILDEYGPNVDKILFLGDYFDSFEYPRNGVVFQEHLAWMKTLFDDPKIIGLLGNHDTHYFATSMETANQYRCSEYNHGKHNQIQIDLGLDFWKKLEFLHFIESEDKSEKILFTHGGLHQNFLTPSFKFDQKHFSKLNSNIKEKFALGTVDNFLNAGRSRGGSQNFGGITWLDFNREFAPIDELTQIVGHTADITIRKKGNNWCLDTHLEHVMILDTISGAKDVIHAYQLI